MLTTTLFLDFGGGIGFNPTTGAQNELVTTVGNFRNVDGPGIHGDGTGSDLTLVGMNLNSSLELRPLNYDFNGDNAINAADITALADAVVPLVRRVLEPFDIDVVVAAAANLADVVTTLGANDGSVDGRNDAYSFVVDAVSDFFNGGSVGDNTSGHIEPGDSTNDGTRLFGIAAADDLFAQNGNQQDEAALTFSDVILDETRGVQGTAEFNSNLVQRIAYTATHEAFHTFSFIHTVGPFSATTNDERLMSDGDIIRTGSSDDARENPFIVTRFDLAHDFPVVEPDNYQLTESDADIGLRDDDGDNRPNLAYVTGTGANDLIQLTLDPANDSIVDVLVTPFSDPARMTQIQRGGNPLQLGYEIRLDDVGALLAETEGTILVDSSHGNDRIEIDAAIAADFRIRTLLGDDEVVIEGADVSRIRSLVVEGEDDDDTLTFDFSTGDALPLAGYDFAFDGGDGTDSTSVRDAANVARSAFFIDSRVNTGFANANAEIMITSQLVDAADTNAGNGVADASIDDGDQITLRAAIQEANAATGPAYVFLPSATTYLTLTGGGNTAGDLDITGDVTLVGAGAGATVIDAGGATGLNDRLFEVRPSGGLDLSRLTLTGGNSSGSGGAIFAQGNSLKLNAVSILNNSAASSGGALYTYNTSTVLSNSVLMDNTAAGAGVIRTLGSSDTLTIGSTIFVNNTNGNGSTAGGINTLTNEITSMGNNLADFSGPFFDGLYNDVVAQVANLQVVTTVADRIDATDNDVALSLREAVIVANGTAGHQTVWLPAWKQRLTERGLSTSALTGDLDISGEVEIIGVGAGFSIIDASALGERIFEVRNGGDLDLSRLTLTGGNSTGSGGAIFAHGDTLDLDQVAVVDNHAASSGGALYLVGTTSVITDSVFTDNTAMSVKGGAIRTDTGTVTLSIGGSIFVNNTDLNNSTAVGINVVTGTITSLGDNLTDFSAPFSDGVNGDTVAQVANLQVVTSVADTFTHTDDSSSLSLREAIALANDDANIDEIWMPAWDFVLTRDRETYGMGSATDVDVSFGDLDISDSLTIRRAGVPLASGVHAVVWRTGVTDRAFELLGDFDNDGFAGGQSASGSDLMVWQQQNGDGSVDPSEWELHSADANDDGLVNQADKDIWSANYGHTLTLTNLIGV